MYELHVRVEDDKVVIEARGAIDEHARAHLRECVRAAEETGLRARVKTGDVRRPGC